MSKCKRITSSNGARIGIDLGLEGVHMKLMEMLEILNILLEILPCQFIGLIKNAKHEISSVFAELELNAVV